MRNKIYALFVSGSLITVYAQITSGWSPAGPVLSTGRARALLIDKSDPSQKTLYLGSVTSGLFRSVDYGTNWSQVNLSDPVRNISYLAQAADNTIYASTGEGFLKPSQRATSLPGTGLYKLVGNTLTQVADSNTLGSRITRISCHPSNAQIIAVASNKGIFLTTNGGNTWTQCSGAISPTMTGFTCEFDPAGNLYATAGNTFAVGLFKSSGANPSGFAAITPSSSQLPSNNFARIEIDFTNGGNTIYASCSNNLSTTGSSFAGLFVSYDGGNSWILVDQGSVQQDPMSFNGQLKQGIYYSVCKVNPLNSNKVFVGSFFLKQWTQTSSNPVFGTWQTFGSPFFSNTQLYLPQGITDIDFEISGGTISKYYILTESGLYRSLDNLMSFQPFFKGINTSQLTSVGVLRDPKYEVNGNTIQPYTDFAATSLGNGVIYFSGKYPSVSKEVAFESGDFFNIQNSNIVSRFAYLAPSTGSLYLTTDISQTQPSILYAFHQATVCGGATPPQISSLPDFRGITNGGGVVQSEYRSVIYTVTGTPIKLWEGYGQTVGNNTILPADPVLFYNDSVRIEIPLTNSVQTSFTFDLPKPQAKAIVDKIIIRTYTTCILVCNSSNVPSNQCLTVATTPTIFTKAVMEFSNTSPTVTSGSYTLTNLTSTSLNTFNNLLYNTISNSDVIKFQIQNTPVSSYTNTGLYKFFRLGVTVFYKYLPGSKIKISSNNIPGYPYQDSTNLVNGATWSFTNTGTASITAASDPTANPVVKFQIPFSARLAIATSTTNGSVLVNKRPLKTPDPILLQVVSCPGAITTSSSSANAGTISSTGIIRLMEWAPDGRSLYFLSTPNLTTTTTYSLFKVYVGDEIYDFTIDDYKGKFYTGAVNGVKQSLTSNVFNYSTNPNSPFRTTLLETFSFQVTSISVSDNSNEVLVTGVDASGNPKVYHASGLNTLLLEDATVNFADKTGNFPNGLITYCSLFELSDNKRVLVGTNKGIYATNDITLTSPTWTSVNNNSLPEIQILDIRQQKLPNWRAYNSGIIYVATNGAGAWINKQFHNPSIQSVGEWLPVTYRGLEIFPNPAANVASIKIILPQNEKITVKVYDIQGKQILQSGIEYASAGVNVIELNSSLLDNGIYLIKVVGDKGFVKTGKLIVRHE